MKKLFLFVVLVLTSHLVSAQYNNMKWHDKTYYNAKHEFRSDDEIYSMNEIQYKNHDPEQLCLQIKYYKNQKFAFLLLKHNVFRFNDGLKVIIAQFDDSPTEEIEFTTISTGERNVINIRLPDAFVKKMKACSYLRILVPVLNEDDMVAEFKVKGFKLF